LVLHAYFLDVQDGLEAVVHDALFHWLHVFARLADHNEFLVHSGREERAVLLEKFGV